MKKAIITILLYLCYTNISAQIDWIQKFNGNGQDAFETITPTMDGGYIFTGSSSSNEGDFADNQGEKDIWIVKTNEFGIEEWSRTYGSSSDDVPIALLPLENSYVVLSTVGDTDGDITTDFVGFEDVWLMEIDLMGNMLQQKSYGGSADDIGVSIKATQDGGFLIAGYTYSNDFIIPDNNGSSDYWLLKLDADFNLVWSKTYGSEGQDLLIEMIALNNGGFVLVGSTSPIFNDDNAKDYYLLKVDENGLVVWEKNYGGSEFEEPRSIIETQTGDLMIVGVTYSEDGDLVENTDNERIWLIKLDANGDLIWGNNYGDYYDSTNLYNIRIAENGACFISGQFVAKVDSNGELLWKTDRFTTTIKDFLVKDNALLCAGRAYSYVDESLGAIFFRLSGNCIIGTQETYLNSNNMNAYLSNDGTLFYENGNSGYEAPKGSNKKAILSGALWMGGIDNEGTLRVAAQLYKNYSESDFLAGPILEEPYKESCNHFDRFWEIQKADVEAFLTIYDDNNGIVNVADIPQSILQYPARNNPHFSDFELPENQDFAPFLDRNNDGNYNPLEGDIPAIKGDQNIWWVYNDKTFHQVSGGSNQLGMEISVMAHSSNTEDYLNNSTFYDFELRYKGEYPLDSFYVGFWVDPTLGNYLDDNVGCNVEQKMGFVYNGDQYDDGLIGYGYTIPALGIQFVKSPLDINGEETNLATFLSHNGTGITGEPYYPQEFYNYLKGYWKDSTPLTYGGGGYGGLEPYPYMFPDDPTDLNGWSEAAEGIPPGSRRFLMSVGPISIQPNEVKTLTIGVHWAPEIGGAGNMDLTPLYDIATTVQADYDELLPYVGADSIDVYLQDIPNATIKAYPNPATTKSTLYFEKTINEPTQINIYSIEGKHIGTYKTSTNAFDLSKTNIAEGSYIFELINKSDTHILKIYITK